MSFIIEGQKFAAIAAEKLNKVNLKCKIAGIRTPAKKDAFASIESVRTLSIFSSGSPRKNAFNECFKNHSPDKKLSQILISEIGRYITDCNIF